MTEQATDRSWVQPGAEVVTYRGGTASRDCFACLTRVERVAKKSFTVEGGDRFDLDTLSRYDGSGWLRTVTRVVPADSDRGRAELAALRLLELKDDALIAVDDWVRDRTRENRRAAIAALQALDDADGGAS